MNWMIILLQIMEEFWGCLLCRLERLFRFHNFQNLNANFAQIFFRVYHNHRYKSWDMIIKIWIHIENVYHWAMSILISECQFCTNIFRLQILLAIFTCCLGRVNNMFKMFLLKIYWRILHSFHSYFFTIFTNLWITKMQVKAKS